MKIITIDDPHAGVNASQITWRPSPLDADVVDILALDDDAAREYAISLREDNAALRAVLSVALTHLHRANIDRRRYEARIADQRCALERLTRENADLRQRLTAESPA